MIYPLANLDNQIVIVIIFILQLRTIQEIEDATVYFQNQIYIDRKVEIRNLKIKTKYNML